MGRRDMRAAVARAVAAAALAGEWETEGMAERAVDALGVRPRWLGAAVRELRSAYRDRPPDRPREVAAVVERWLEAREDDGHPPRLPRVREAPLFAPEMGRRRWPVAEAATTTDLAELLDLHPDELRWLADVRGLERRAADEGCATTATASSPGRTGARACSSSRSACSRRPSAACCG